MHSTMRYASGKVLTKNGFIEGYVGYEAGVVVEVGEGKKRGAAIEGVIVPTLVNSHTHIADSIVPLDTKLSMEELVKPPHGLKHRVLNTATEKQLRDSITRASVFMRRRGISNYIDFREGGPEGAQVLATSFGKPRATIFGRPRELKFDPVEMEALVEVVDGIGVSSISDWDYGDLEQVAGFARSRGKRFALHASERVREDIDRVLALKPDFIVHMTKASVEDLQACAEKEARIVVCPRSNLFFGNLPPLAAMLEQGVEVSLGTDNAMFCTPDMLVEMEFAARLLRLQGVKDVGEVLAMGTSYGRKLLNGKVTIGIEPGFPCDFMVVRDQGGDPATDLVLKGSSADPLMVCMGNEIWSGER
ncbi:MAG TPA: amidohydrolase family protein [Methanomassiliicoccales archaeon]|nr:amidohydrolase family protein [Methanomassiliicoccales archaeon]